MNGMNIRSYWIAGVLTALAGVAVARIVAPALHSSQVSICMTIVGQLVAISGLFIVMLGTRKRYRAMKRDQEESVDPL